MLRAARILTGREAEAEDLAQDTMLKGVQRDLERASCRCGTSERRVRSVRHRLVAPPRQQREASQGATASYERIVKARMRVGGVYQQWTLDH